MIFPIKKYSEITKCVIFNHYSKGAFIFGPDSKMVIKIQLKYVQIDFILELFSDANSLE